MAGKIIDMKIAVLFSGKGSNLGAILASSVKPHIELCLTDNPDAPGIISARSYGLPVVIANYRDYVNKSEFEQTVLNKLKKSMIDYVVLAGFMRILSTNFVSQYNHRIINIHPSLLPSYAGLNTHERVIQNGNKIHGVTIHFVTPQVDAGPIIAQGAIRVHPNDTPKSLQERIHKLEHLIYPQVISWIIKGQIYVNDQGKVIHPFCTGFFMDD
ncbi:phosphoribosylglycinamide formyltransferase [Candidatus Ichthyocystis hellenicum]|uniref:phosphoribosylglycinamide formyltransferase n=1 Tax=Candidatus Ichthyocystis hellenicum TaxID=1561003 RepID=UPI000B82DA8C|nr:phosphoribosylglycinamide formyltransferase [Candidatus Ichthyocystis hellenicum]